MVKLVFLYKGLIKQKDLVLVQLICFIRGDNLSPLPSFTQKQRPMSAMPSWSYGNSSPPWSPSSHQLSPMVEKFLSKLYFIFSFSHSFEIDRWKEYPNQNQYLGTIH